MVLTSIPGITGTGSSMPLILVNDDIRLWSVTASPIPRSSARDSADFTSVKESEQLVWKCMSMAVRPLARISSQSGLANTASMGHHLMHRVRQASSDSARTDSVSSVVIFPLSTTTSPWQRTVLTFRLLPE